MARPDEGVSDVHPYTERRELVRPGATIAYWVSGPERAPVRGAAARRHTRPPRLGRSGRRPGDALPRRRARPARARRVDAGRTRSGSTTPSTTSLALLDDGRHRPPVRPSGGLSLGGNIAQEIVHRDPERVDALVVADSTCNTAPRHPLAAPLTIAALSAMALGGRERFMQHAAAVTSPHDDVRQYVLDANEDRTTREVVQILASLLDARPAPGAGLPAAGADPAPARRGRPGRRHRRPAPRTGRPATRWSSSW